MTVLVERMQPLAVARANVCQPAARLVAYCGRDRMLVPPSLRVAGNIPDHQARSCSRRVRVFSVAPAATSASEGGPLQNTLPTISLHDYGECSFLRYGLMTEKELKGAGGVNLP